MYNMLSYKHCACTIAGPIDYFILVSLYAKSSGHRVFLLVLLVGFIKKCSFKNGYLTIQLCKKEKRIWEHTVVGIL